MNDRVREIVRRLNAGTSLHGLGLETFRERWDLRNVEFARHSADLITAGKSLDGHLGVVSMKKVKWERLDLTGATWAHLRLNNVTIRDCVFDRATMEDASFGECTIEDCSFQRTTLRNAGMGSAWTAVDFRSADLRDTFNSGAVYTDCDFRGARLGRADYGGASHVRSRFEGVLKETYFGRRSPADGRWRRARGRLDHCDFSGARLDWTEFHGLDLVGSRLPTEPGHVFAMPKVAVARWVLERLAVELAQDAQVGLRVIMEAWVRQGPDTEQAIGAAYRSNLGDTNEERDTAQMMIEEAAAAIGGRGWHT